MMSLQDVIEVVDQLSPEEKAQLREYLDTLPTNGQHLPQKRIAGLHEHLGHAWISDDFDDELPDSFWLGEDA
jgi:hypothetical protein